MMQENRQKKTLMLLPTLIVLLWAHPYSVIGSEMKDILERSRTIKAEYEKQIQDLTVMQEGECKIPGAESKMTVKTVSKGRKFRMENITRQEGPGAESTLVSVVTSNDGENVFINIAPGVNRKATLKEANLLRPEVFWWSPFIKDAMVKGPVKMNDRDCYLFEITDQEAGPFTKIWVDAKTLAPVQADALKKSGKLVRMVFSDFKEIFPGYEIPQQTDTLAEGIKMITMKVKEIQKNQGVDDKIFNMDEIRTKND